MLSTTAKVSLAVGAVAVAVGAFMLYKRASATAAEESEDETDSEGEEEEVTAETASPSATKVRSQLCHTRLPRSARVGRATCGPHGAAGAAAATCSCEHKNVLALRVAEALLVLPLLLLPPG